MENSISSSEEVPYHSQKTVIFSIFRYFPHGGLQRNMMCFAAELTQRGYRVIIYCGKWEAPLPDNIEVRQLIISAWSNHGRAKKFAERLISELQNEQYLIHVAFNRLAGADLYFSIDKPFIASAQKWNFWKRLSPCYHVFKELEADVFGSKSKTVIMGITRRQLAEYRCYYHTPESRMILLPPGISPECRRPEIPEPIRRNKRLELGVAEDEILLLEVGSGFLTKGVDRAIAAFASLPLEIRERTRLFIAGRGNSGQFRQLAIRFGIANRVHFLGGRDDIPQLLLAADLLIHPARNEVGGTALLEALAAGTPVIVSGNCGFADYVAKSGGIVLRKPFHQVELNKQLWLALSSPERLAELQREATAYGPHADFYRRTQVVAEIIERMCHVKA